MKRLLSVILLCFLLGACAKEEVHPARIFSGGYDLTFDLEDISGYVKKDVGETYIITFSEPTSLRKLKLTYTAGVISVQNGSSIQFDGSYSIGANSAVKLICSAVEESIKNDSLEGETEAGRFKIEVDGDTPKKIKYQSGTEIIIRDFIRNN